MINSAGPCLDVDGDGYGVGPSCLGPDADDNDTNVHSPAQVIAKYGSINAFLLHLGYQSSSAPVPVYCISPTGNDSKGLKSTNADTACATPFQTWKGVYVHFQPAGVPAIIMFRAGTYNQQIMPNIGGTPSQSVYAHVLSRRRGDHRLFRFDGGSRRHSSIPVYHGHELADYCEPKWRRVLGGTTSSIRKEPKISPSLAMFLHTVISGGGTDSNVDADNTTNFTVQYNVVHDPATSGQHNIYRGSNTVTTTHAVVSNNILDSVHTCNYPNLQFNGRCTDCYFENNILYNSDGQEIAFTACRTPFCATIWCSTRWVAGGRSLSFSLVNGTTRRSAESLEYPQSAPGIRPITLLKTIPFGLARSKMDGQAAKWVIPSRLLTTS